MFAMEFFLITHGQSIIFQDLHWSLEMIENLMFMLVLIVLEEDALVEEAGIRTR